MKRKEPLFKYESVMLIDDNDLDNFINEKTLEGNLFAKTVYKNTSAQSALEFLDNIVAMGPKAGEQYPRVIFIDINMPMIDGFQFIELYKKNTETKIGKPKLVVLTSSVSDQDAIKTQALGEEILFLRKPLTIEMLEKV